LDLTGKKLEDSGEGCIMRAFIICTVHHTVYKGGHIEEDELGL
jgi:hypothetical protein